MLFFDTNIISYHLNNYTKSIIDKMSTAIDKDEILCTTNINIYEILKGFRWKNNKNKETQFNKLLEDFIVFTIDDEVVKLAASIYADLRKRGITIGDADILIAAIVINNKGRLVTNNTKHYKDIIDLNLVNWLE